MLVVQTVVLLISKIERIVLEVQQRGRVTCIVHGTTTLQRHLAGVHVVRYRFNHYEHAAFDLLVIGIRHIRPAVLVHVFLDGLLQRLEYLFVRTFDHVRINCHGTIDLLRLKGNKEQRTKSKDYNL